MNKQQISSIILILISLAVSGQTKIEKIESLMSEEKVYKARALINEVLLEDSINPKLYLYKGLIIQNQIEMSHPSDTKKLILDSAYHFYTKALRYDTEGILISILSEHLLSVSQQYSFTGMEQFNEGKYKAALEIFERNLEISNLPYIHQLDTMMLYNAAITADKLKDYPKVEYYYLEILKHNPRDWNSVVSLANTYKKQGYTDKYFSTISKANKKNPEVLVFYNEIIGYYLENQKTDSALVYLDLLLDRDTQNDKMYYLKGSILQEQGEIELSNKQYKRSLEINSNNVDAAYNLAANGYNNAIVLLKKKKLTKEEKQSLTQSLKETLEYLEVVKKHEPQNTYVLSMLLTCYQELGMKDKESELRKYIQTLQ